MPSPFTSPAAATLLPNPAPSLAMSAAPSPEVAAQSFTEDWTVHVPDDMSSTYTAPRSVPPQSSERAPTARSGTASPFTSPSSATADPKRHAPPVQSCAKPPAPSAILTEDSSATTPALLRERCSTKTAP